MYSEIKLEMNSLQGAIDALSQGISMNSNDNEGVYEAKLQLSRLFERNNQTTKTITILKELLQNGPSEFFIRASARLLHCQAVYKYAAAQKIDLAAIGIKVISTITDFDDTENITNLNWFLLSVLAWSQHFKDRNNYAAATSCVDLLRKCGRDKKWQLLCYLVEHQLIISNQRQPTNVPLDEVKRLLDGPPVGVLFLTLGFSIDPWFYD